MAGSDVKISHLIKPLTEDNYVYWKYKMEIIFKEKKLYAVVTKKRDVNVLNPKIIKLSR